MRELWSRIQEYIASRSQRERWMLALAGAVAVLFVAYSAIIAPLGSSARASQANARQLDGEILRARQLAAEIRAVQGGVEAIQARIRTGERTNLLALIESLAARSAIPKEQIESIKPSPVSRNDQYPETKVTVSLRGTTLDQTLRFLQAIEASDAHLIMRSLQVRKGRSKAGGTRLDVTMSVSSFERA